MVEFELDWGEHADGGVPPAAVVAFFEPASHGELGAGFGGPGVPVVELGFRVDQNDSLGALSQQTPVRPTDACESAAPSEYRAMTQRLDLFGWARLAHR